MKMKNLLSDTGTTNASGKRRSLRGDTRGAVLAEFVIALLPMLTVFFVFVQYSMLVVSALLVKHATVVGARAAAVFSNEHSNVPELCNDKGDGKVSDAVRAALGPWSNRITTNVEITDKSSRDENDGVYDLVTVKVTAQVKCNVPLGKIMCGFSGYKEVVDIKSMPHQGARYKTRQCEDVTNSGGGGFPGFGGGRSGGAGGGGDFGGGGAGGSW